MTSYADLCCRADRNDALQLEPESDRMERKTFVKEKICEEKMCGGGLSIMALLEVKNLESPLADFACSP